MKKSIDNIFTSKKTKDKPSRFFILLAGMSFVVPLCLIYLYSYSPNLFHIAGLEIKKMELDQENIEATLTEVEGQSVYINKEKSELKLIDSADKTVGTSTKPVQLTNQYDSIIESSIVPSTDSTGKRIIIIGDSECYGLRFPLNDYCIHNGHKLEFAMIWNSATILNLAYSDTIEKIIAKYKPTYIFIVVGMNELYAKDIKKRKIAADIFATKIKGIPYTWIGPANYREDFGINKVFQSSADSGSFFYTNTMALDRGSDGRHPNKQGYKVWMDSIASWIEQSGKYKLPMKKPLKFNNSFKARAIHLNAAKFRGY